MPIHFRIVEAVLWIVALVGLMGTTVDLLERDARKICRFCKTIRAMVGELFLQHSAHHASRHGSKRDRPVRRFRRSRADDHHGARRKGPVG